MARPDGCDPVYEAEEMRAVEKWAIEERGVPSLDLMERAGIGLARIVADGVGPGPARVTVGEGHKGGGRVAGVVGKGSSGGDGLVVARLLRDEGRDVDVLSTGDPAELKGDAKTNLE